jgi:hypothetical protein
MLVEAMKRLGPCLSTQLTDYLVETHGLQPAAARQRVSRAPQEILRLDIPFPRRARFLYLQEHDRSPQYWAAFHAAISELDGSYARALVAVGTRTLVPLAHFSIVCGAPAKQKGHLAAEAILARLRKAEVLDVIDMRGLGPCVVTRAYTQRQDAGAAAKTQARLLTERVLLETTREWAKRMSMASWNKVALRDDPLPNGEPPRVGTFHWDFTSPSYLAALGHWNKEGKRLPGWLVCDVLLNREVSLEALGPFLHKCKTLQQLRNVAKTLHLFIAHGYEDKALRAAREAGVMAVTPNHLFGRAAAEAFRLLAQTLTQAALGSVDPEKFQKLITGLSTVEGAVGNMRGAFFELLVAEIIRRTEPGGADARINYVVYADDGAEAEVDVYLKTQNRQLMIECKGRNPDTVVDDEEIETWLKKRIPRVREHLQRGHHGPAIKPEFELWITGRLSKAAIEKIEKTRDANQRVFDLRLIWAKPIREKIYTLNDAKFVQTMTQHFLPQLEGDQEDTLLARPIPRNDTQDDDTWVPQDEFDATQWDSQ